MLSAFGAFTCRFSEEEVAELIKKKSGKKNEHKVFYAKKICKDLKHNQKKEAKKRQKRMRHSQEGVPSETCITNLPNTCVFSLHLNKIYKNPKKIKLHFEKIKENPIDNIYYVSPMLGK